MRCSKVLQSDKIQLFEDKRIRTAWDEEQKEWYFSVVDVVAVLTDQPDARHASTYWAVLKKRLNSEGAGQLLTNCKQLKMTASDGKRRLTDVADTEQLLRIMELCMQFRDKVNENDLVYHIYRNRDGKDQWNIICSAMD